MGNLVKRTISVILLFVMYVLIANLSNKVFITDGWSKEKSVYINIFCSCISIFVTIVYKFIVLKFFGLEDKKAVDYILSLVVFLIADISFCSIVPMNDDYWSGSGFDRIILWIQSLYMYVIGNSAYILVCYLKRGTREREQGDMLRRGISAMVLLIVLVLFTDKAEFYDFVIIPLVYYCFSVMFYKDEGSGIECYILSMGIYFSVLAIRISTLEYEYGCLLVTLHLCTYLLCCFLHFVLRRIWCAMKNKEKYMNEDEYGIGKLSSEIILIPGIDGDLGEDKKDSVSAEND